MPENENNRGFEDFTPEQKKIYEELEGKVWNHPDFISRKTYEELFDKLGVKKGDKILDSGAGFIHLTDFASEYPAALSERGVTLVPVDVEEAQMKSWMLLPREREDENDSVAHPVRADILKLPFADETFEGAMSLNVVNSLKDKKYLPLLLVELYRALKPGGFVIISTFGYYKTTTKDGKVSYNNKISPEAIITPEEIKKAAQESGFTKIEDVPLDAELIKRETEYARKFSTQKVENFEDLEMVEPAGILIRK